MHIHYKLVILLDLCKIHSMNLQILSLVISGLLVVSNVIFIVHLNRRIESQSNQLKDVQTYTSIISIDELKKFDEYRRETLWEHIKIMMKDISKEETEKHFIELNKEIDEKIKMTTETGKHEFVSFCIIALGAFPKEKRNQLIEQAFPKNKQSIIDYFNNREK